MPVPFAVIAGIPREVARRGTKPARPGWEIQVVPGSQDRRADLRAVWARVMNVADQAGAEGVHLILSHDGRRRPNFSELRSRSYRATWLPPGLSAGYGQPKFNTAIDDVLAFEECWRARIRPQLSSPLLLPATAFSADRSVRSVWNRACTVHQGRDSISAIEKALVRFRRLHWQNRRWRDTGDLVFVRSPTLHGSHGIAPWRNNKLTFRIPSGTHFDVRHSRNRRFRVSDQSGESHSFDLYTNIDPHGFVRGGR